MFAKSLFVTKKRPWSALILVSIMAVFHDKKKVRKMIPAAVLTVLLTLTLLPMTVRAAQTTWAPAAASRTATAAPKPRDAPVTSASRPSRGFAVTVMGQARSERAELRRGAAAWSVRGVG